MTYRLPQFISDLRTMRYDNTADIKTSHRVFQGMPNKWVVRDGTVPYRVHVYLLPSMKLNGAVKFLIFLRKETGVFRLGYPVVI
jgi:hypothetical protein